MAIDEPDEWLEWLESICENGVERSFHSNDDFGIFFT